MDNQTPQDPNKIDLSSVNQQPKQKKEFKLPSFLKRKKAVSPGRDHLGQFSSGSGGLKSVKKFNWIRALPLVLIVSIVGGYLVFRSFAGTYKSCATAANGYRYSEQCVTDSDEAAVVRLYYGIFNRAPDKSGLEYWTNKLNKKTITLAEMARQFMGSSEFSRKYGTLNNDQFVRAMYPQVFGRAPDPSGLKYWVDRLNAKSVTRQAMMTNFTQSSEMKRNFAQTVARDLGVLENLAGEKITTGNIECYGSIESRTDGSKWCNVNIKQNSAERSGFWVTSIMNVPITLQTSMAWLDAETEGRLLNGGGQSISCGIDVYRYTGVLDSGKAYTSSSNSYGGGMGGCGSLGSTTEKVFLGNGYGLYPSNLNGLLTTASIRTEEYKKLPSNAVVSIKMTGINFRGVPRGASYPNEQKVTAKVHTNSSNKINIKGKLYDLRNQLNYISANMATNSIDWSQTMNQKIAGKLAFSLEGATAINSSQSSGYDLKFKVNVYNADTNKLITPGEYQVYALGKQLKSVSDVYSIKKAQGSYYSGDAITVALDPRFPTKFRFDVDIVSPTDYKLFSSNISSK